MPTSRSRLTVPALLVRIMLLVVSTVSSQNLKIKLLEPSPSSVYTVTEVNQNLSISIIYEAEIFNKLEALSSQVCLRVNNADTEVLLLQSTCFDVEDGKVKKILDNVNVGNFIMSLDILDNQSKIIDRISSLFHVKEKRFLVPEITVVHTSTSSAVTAVNESHERDISVVVSESVDTKFAVVFVDFSLSASLLLESDYKVCANVAELHSGAMIMELFCLPPRQQFIETRSLLTGSYILSLAVYDTNMDSEIVPGRIFTNSLVTTRIHVKTLDDEDMVPSLDIGHEMQEFGILSPEHESEYEIKCPVTGVPSAVHQLLVCVEVHHSKNRAHKVDNTVADTENSLLELKTVVPLTCLAKDTYSFSLRGIATGLYKIKVILRLAHSPYTFYKTSEKIIKLDVRDFVEITPTYNWQMLHAWHTIPSGLETRCLHNSMIDSCHRHIHDLPVDRRRNDDINLLIIFLIVSL